MRTVPEVSDCYQWGCIDTLMCDKIRLQLCSNKGSGSYTVRWFHLSEQRFSVLVSHWKHLRSFWKRSSQCPWDLRFRRQSLGWYPGNFPEAPGGLKGSQSWRLMQSLLKWDPRRCPAWPVAPPGISTLPSWQRAIEEGAERARFVLRRGFAWSSIPFILPSFLSSSGPMNLC